MYKEKLGIAIISFDRPKYFKQVIQSLEKQTYLENTDFILFQDGQTNKFSGRITTNQSLILKCIETFKRAHLKNKTEFIEQENIGNALNQFKAVEYMSKNYDYFIVLEDDAVLGKDYLKIIRIMIDQFFRIPNVFSVSAGFRRLCNLNKYERFLDKARYVNEHWWAECWKSENWYKIRPFFLEYINLVKDCDYKLRPIDKIKRLFNKYNFHVPQTSQDAGRDMSLYKTGMKRICTIVNRGFYIGEYGLHFRPVTYKNYKFGSMKPYEFEIDKTIEKFVLINN